MLTGSRQLIVGVDVILRKQTVDALAILDQLWELRRVARYHFAEFI